jgi:Raf kinase inhibitor-like YbhB/YbcL family protein
MKAAFERFLSRLLAGRHADDQYLLSRAPLFASAAPLQLTSPAFAAGGAIPRDYTQEGADRFPPLAWSGLPANAKEVAIVVEDPDAPLPRPIVHCIVYGLPAAAGALTEAEANAPGFAHFGKNSRGGRDYRGPRPLLGHGPHRYVFQLFALAQPLGLTAPPTKKVLLQAMAGRVLARGELIGTYERR